MRGHGGAGAQPGAGGLGGGPVFGVYQVQRAAAYEFRGGVAQHPLPGRVDQPQPAVEAGYGHKVGGGIKKIPV